MTDRERLFFKTVANIVTNWMPPLMERDGIMSYADVPVGPEHVGEIAAMMLPRDEIREAMREMTAQPIRDEPLQLLVSRALFDLGEERCREVLRVGPGVEIIESVPIAYPGDSHRPPRRYPARLRKIAN